MRSEQVSAQPFASDYHMIVSASLVSPVPRKKDINSHLSPSSYFPACNRAEYIDYF